MQHYFDIELAERYGILEAVIINHLQFWIAKNKANECNYYDGYYWSYFSTKAIAELFPYANDRQIRYALNKLIKEGVLQTGNYNKMKYDRTLWYAFTDFGLELLKKQGVDLSKADNENGNSIYKNSQMEKQEFANQNTEIVEPIPDNKTDNETFNKKDNIEKKPQKRFFPPTIEEVKNYCLERNNKVDAERFVDYYESKGWIVGKSKMKDWKAAVRTWEKNTFANDTKPKQEPEMTEQQQELLDMWSNL